MNDAKSDEYVLAQSSILAHSGNIFVTFAPFILSVTCGKLTSYSYKGLENCSNQKASGFILVIILLQILKHFISFQQRDYGVPNKRTGIYDY